jgi:hypothetical protein
VDGERESLTVGQVCRIVFGLGVIVLLAIRVGHMLRDENPATPFAASGSAAAGPGSAGDGQAERDAELARTWTMLMGNGGLSANDPSALNKTVGAPVVLTTAEAELRVTATRVGVGTAACADGPLVTVDLLVESVSGSVALPLNEFHLKVFDGTVAEPIPACSTGFTEAAEQRTLVFAAAEPDRLLFGADPAAPEVQWFLT